jgi:hypothetical protein
MVTTQVRLPTDLHAALVEAADRNRRSLDAEMQWRLERSLEIRAPTNQEIESMLARFQAKWVELEASSAGIQRQLDAIKDKGERR